jgi:hypothetical protein
MTGWSAAAIGAFLIAGVSTLGDFIWATWIPRHEVRYGMAHGVVLFLCIGLYLGALANRPLAGGASGAAIGGAAAGSFYVFAPLVGYAVMFFVWIAVWVALGGLDARLNRRRGGLRSALTRGAIAALGSGVAFYAISGIWSPFNPVGWDYLVHFGAWTLAYLPGLGGLLTNQAAPQPAR